MLFNARTASLVEIDAESEGIIQQILKNPSTATSSVETEYVSQLHYGGFLVDAEKDEVVHLKDRNRTMRLSGGTCSLTIAPTLACNFKCDYCFESPAGLVMDSRTCEALLTFTEHRLTRNQNLLVTWFGGEPTLCLPTVINLQSRLRALADKNDVDFKPASIVTNGYRLDRIAASKIAAEGIASAQITVDGPQAIHDRRRPHRCGRGTYERIMENIEQTADVLQIVIRVNVDLDNMEMAGDVLEDLDRRGLRSRVRVSFAPVHATGEACADLSGRCFSTESFARAEAQLYYQLHERGYSAIDYPTPAAGTYCSADSIDSYVIGPNGLLFKCWEELSINAAASVGSLHEDRPSQEQQRNLERYLQWDPFAKQECVECGILPLCMGGCPKRAMELENPIQGSCVSWKFNLGDILTMRLLSEPNEKEVRP